MTHENKYLDPIPFYWLVDRDSHNYDNGLDDVFPCFCLNQNLTNETVSVGFEHCQFDDVPVFGMIFRYSSELQLWTSHIFEPRDLSQEIHHFSYQNPSPSSPTLLSSSHWQFLQGGRQGHLAAGLVGPRPRNPSRRSRATPRESHPRRIGGATTAGGRGAPQNSGFPNTQ